MSKTQIDAPEGVPFVDITREFDAPLELVRRAWTDPDLVKQWLGPRKYEMVIEQWDARAGGAYRYVHRDDDCIAIIDNFGKLGRGLTQCAMPADADHSVEDEIGSAQQPLVVRLVRHADDVDPRTAPGQQRAGEDRVATVVAAAGEYDDVRAVGSP